MKQCVTCLEYKTEEEDNWRYKHLNQRHKICRDCQNHHSRNWYGKHKEEQIERVKVNRDRVRYSTRKFVWEYLKTHPCIECGETDPIVLEFDHIKRKGCD